MPLPAQFVLDSPLLPLLSSVSLVNAEALTALGGRLLAQGKAEAALAAFEITVVLDPQHLDGWLAVASLRYALGLPQAALQACNQALSLAPDNGDALFSAAVVLQSLGSLEAALHCYAQCLQMVPQHREALLNRSYLLLLMQRPEDAVQAAEAALCVDRANPEFWMNCGEAWLAHQGFAEALAAYRQVLVLQPGNSRAELAAAVAEAAQGRLTEATRRMEMVATSDLASWQQFRSPLLADYYSEFPEVEAGRIALLVAHARMCRVDFTARAELEPLFAHVVAGDGCKPLDHPDLPFLAIGLPALGGDIRLKAAQQVARRLLSEVNGTVLVRPPERDRARRRIAYLSGDVRRHATAFMLDGFFALHDRQQYEVFLYSSGPDDGSDFRRRLMNEVEHFCDVHGMAPNALAQRIAMDRIDVLIDVSGYTAFGRPAALALRPAPVQVGWLGYLATTGAPWLDYVLLDREVLTGNERQWWSEAVASVPFSMFFADGRRPQREIKLTRVDFGLPEEALIYCCFCAPWKISAPVLVAWAQVLTRVSGAILWLYADNAVAAANLRREAVAHGIPAECLFISGKMDHERHMVRFALADIALDTFDCNGITTSLEALESALPIVTFPGQTVVQRACASMLRAHGLPELIAETEEDYVEIACRLGEDVQWRATLRARCAQRQGSVFFSAEGFVRTLEAGYTAMWQRHQRGERPLDFNVTLIA